MPIKDKVKNNARLKKLVHFLLVPRGEARPRLWVKLFVNPFFHKYDRGSIVRRRVRMDVLPFNNFVLGSKSVIEDFSTINNGVGDVFIGKETTIGMSNVIIGPVTVGNNVIMAQNIVASGLNHNYKDVHLPIQQQGVSMAPIHIEDDCWIGANVVVTAGVTIGRHSVVAAGSVVTKNVPAFSVAAGNPARVIRRYDEAAKDWVRV